METYTLHLCGLTRELRLVQIAEHLKIAGFNMFGDTQIIERCAEGLCTKVIERFGKPDLLVCPEAKGIPLTHSMAVKFGIDYVVARKSVKGYMSNPLVAEVKSITTNAKQIIVIDSTDVEKLAGKKVCIVDDVVSTGGSLEGLKNVLERTNCHVIGKASALLEEAGYDGKDLAYLATLPIFHC